MLYQTKWMKNILRLFSFRSSSLTRTFLVGGLLIGCMAIALVSLQLFQANAQGTSATSNGTGQANQVSNQCDAPVDSPPTKAARNTADNNTPNVSMGISSGIDRTPERPAVTYTLTIGNQADGGTIRRGVPITFTDTIPPGLSDITAEGDCWDTKVSPSASPPLVTGTYRGSYPVAPGATLPPVTITGTITPEASSVLSNSASVNVPGNADQAYSKAIVNDDIGLLLSSLSLLGNGSDTCDNTCDQQDIDTTCDNICDQQDTNTACADNHDDPCSRNTTQSDPSNEKSNTSNRESDPSGKGSSGLFPDLPDTGGVPD